MKVLAVIPARKQSTRLPGKPLKDIAGKTLLERVYRQACQAKTLTRVIIATDDADIVDHAKSFGAEVMLTSDTLATGSDRVAATYEQLNEHFDLVANVQGDMPFINPEVIDLTVSTLAMAPDYFSMSTVITPLYDEEEFLRPSAVKAVRADDGGILYFSRAPIPFIRDKHEFTPSLQTPWGYKHMGLYVFRPQGLSALSRLPQSDVELREKLEQLRALAHGMRIIGAVASREMVHPAIEVDTVSDLERAIAYAFETKV